MATVSPPDLEAELALLDPDVRYEVVDGIIVEKPMSAFASKLAFLIGHRLEAYAGPLGIGQSCVEMLFDLRPAFDRRRCPDAAFVSSERWALDLQVPETVAWPVIPDLAIEVVSPTNTATEVLDKIGEYLQAGVRLVWIVFPKHKQVYAYESKNSIRVFDLGMELDGGQVLPGFRLSITELFGEPAASP